MAKVTQSQQERMRTLALKPYRRGITTGSEGSEWGVISGTVVFYPDGAAPGQVCTTEERLKGGEAEVKKWRGSLHLFQIIPALQRKLPSALGHSGL